jgi:hypothetical protein
MPAFPVTVSASYDAASAPEETARRLSTWASARDGRTFVVDDSIEPVRWTVTVDYAIHASSAHDAEQIAVERFATDSSDAGIVPAETVVAATGPLS